MRLGHVPSKCAARSSAKRRRPSPWSAGSNASPRAASYGASVPQPSRSSHRKAASCGRAASRLSEAPRCPCRDSVAASSAQSERSRRLRPPRRARAFLHRPATRSARARLRSAAYCDHAPSGAASPGLRREPRCVRSCPCGTNRTAGRIWESAIQQAARPWLAMRKSASRATNTKPCAFRWLSAAVTFPS